MTTCPTPDRRQSWNHLCKAKALSPSTLLEVPGKDHPLTSHTASWCHGHCTTRNNRKSAVPKTPLKVRICTHLSYVSSWGSVSCAFPTFFWPTPLLAAGHWLNRAKSPAMSTESCSLHNCRTCYSSAAALALEAELRMQPWLQTTVESEQETTEIKAAYLSIPATEPILGTDSGDIPNTQHQQSSQIPPYSYLNP